MFHGIGKKHHQLIIGAGFPRGGFFLKNKLLPGKIIQQLPGFCSCKQFLMQHQQLQHMLHCRSGRGHSGTSGLRARHQLQQSFLCLFLAALAAEALVYLRPGFFISGLRAHSGIPVLAGKHERLLAHPGVETCPGLCHQGVAVHIFIHRNIMLTLSPLHADHARCIPSTACGLLITPQKPIIQQRFLTRSTTQHGHKIKHPARCSALHFMSCSE